MAGAAVIEILGDSRSANWFVFINKMRLQSAKSKLGEQTGCGCSFHVQMIFGSYSDHSLIGFVWLGQFTNLRARS